MPSFEVIYRNGTVVNQDGRGARDIGVTGGRVAFVQYPSSGFDGNSPC